MRETFKEVIMKKRLSLIFILFGGVVFGLIASLLLPAEERARLSQPVAVRFGRILERLPDV